MFQLLFFILISHGQNTCFEIFEKPAPSTVARETPMAFREQAEKLAILPSRNLEELYLHLIIEEARWLYSKQTLPSEVLNVLQLNFSGRYNIPTEPSKSAMFYSNALASLAGRVAWEWKKQTIEELAGEKISGPTLLTAQALMDSYFSIQGLADRQVSPERAREYFETKAWEDFPWKEAITVTRAWHNSPESERGFTRFYPWYEKQTGLPQLSPQTLERLYLALMKDPSPVGCCKSTSPCLSCPHNRAWLTESNTEKTP